MNQKPSLGRIVLVCIGVQPPSNTNAGEKIYRPASVVAVWSDECVNVKIDLDGTNDNKHNVAGCPWGEFTEQEQQACTAWRTSLLLGDGLGQWMWPPRA